MKSEFADISKIKSVNIVRLLGIFVVSLVLIGTMFGPAQAAISAGQRAALIALYNSTGGDSWTDNSNWKTVTPPDFAAAGTECTWFGVTCNAGETNVIRLNLDSNNLSGSISNLSLLASLQVLDLSSNSIGGSIPATVDNLTSLTDLDLSGNGLGSSIPNLSSLVDLAILKLGENSLSGAIPTWLNNLSDLVEISLFQNNLTGPIPATWDNLPGLQRLFLSWNNSLGPIPVGLSDLGSLEQLYIHDAGLTGSIPAELGQLSTLQELHLYNNSLSGPIPPELGDLGALQDLQLDENQLTGSIPTEFGDLTNLQVLLLNDNQLNGVIPDGLINLPLIDDESNLCDNSLSTSNNALRDFLIAKTNPDWNTCQDVTLTLDKASTATDFDEVGDTIDYTFEVTNSGGATVSSIAVSDSLGIVVTCPQTSLDAGQSTTCTASYTVIQTDLDAGQVVNTASATGTSGGSQVASNSDSVTVTAVFPDISVDPESWDYGTTGINQSLPKTFIVSNVAVNIRTLAVTNTVITGDDAFSITQGGGAFNLASGETHDIVVTFNPTATGTFNATLDITSNDPDESPFSVALTGEVVDTDSDGLSDPWEIANFGNLDQTGDGDPDGDDLTNLQEQALGSDPNNARPATPVLVSPDDGATGVSLMPTLVTDAFSDPEVDAHDMTRWQISTDEEFSDNTQLVFDFQSSTDLIQIEVPGLFLNLDTDYYWRANHTDDAGQTSGWPEPFMFSTVPTDPDDTNGNGIADDQEVDCAVLFNGSAIPANTVCVNSANGSGQVGVEPGTNVDSIDAFMAMDPDDIPDELANVTDVELLLGLISFKATATNVGDTIQMIFHFSEPLPDNVECWKWDPDNGWYDYSAHIVAVGADRRSITMEYKDGDFGDIDKIANRVVIDPAGFGAAPAGGGGAPPPAGGGGGGGGGCFIVSAKDASPVTGKILALILLLGSGITVLFGFKRS